MENDVRAVVLAGGFGSRLMPLTERVPKPLLEICGESALERTVRLLLKNGIKTLAVTTFYLAEQVERLRVEGAELKFFRERRPLGTAGSVKGVEKEMGQTFVVMSGDTVCDFDLAGAVKRHRERNALATVLAVRSESPTEYGTLITEGGEIRSFDEKPSWSRTASNLVNTGIYVFDKGIFKYLDGSVKDFAGELFPLLLAAGEKIYCDEQKGFWWDIGDIKSYYDCSFALSGGKRNLISPTATVSPAATLDGAIVLGNAVIEEGAVVSESIICDGAFIGKNAKLESGTVIGAETVVSEGAYVAENVILKGGMYLGKEARLMKSTVFGEVRRKLMDGGRIRGRFGSGINGELCLQIGEALACKEYPYEKEKPLVGVMHCGTEESRVLADAILCGGRLYGAEVMESERGFEAMAAYLAKTYGLDASVFVRSYGGDTELFLYDRDGLPPTRQFERSFEAALNRYNLPASRVREGRRFLPEERPRFLYAKGLEESVGELGGLSFLVAEKNDASEFLFAVSREKGAAVRYAEELSPEEASRMEVFSVSKDGFGASLRLSTGESYGFWELLCLAARAQGGRVVLPALSPLFVEQELKKQGLDVEFCGGTESLERSEVYSMPWTLDGAALCLKVLEAAKKRDCSLTELCKGLPRFSYGVREVRVDDSRKAEKIEALGKLGERGRKGEGIRLSYERGSVVVVPMNSGGFRIFTEAVSTEAAEEIFAQTEKKLRS